MSNSTNISKPELINLEKVISEKSPILSKFLPGFMINYLKRIVHEDTINSFLSKSGHLTGINFIKTLLAELNTKIDITGIDNIPEKGGYIIASNHPLGGLDGLALMLAISDIRKDIVFPVNDILMNIKNLEPLFIPINKHGSNTQNIQIINDFLK